MTVRFYILPIQRIIDERGDQRGPKYIKWRDDLTGLEGYPWAMMDYGFAPFGLVVIKNISQVDHDGLVLNADVYEYQPLDALAVTIAPQDDLDTFFEGIGIPTDWLNPANTYLEFLRQTAAMFQFNQRYGGISVSAQIDTNQGNLSFLESPFAFQDLGQDFSEWLDKDMVISVESIWDIEYEVALLSDDTVILRKPVFGFGIGDPVGQSPEAPTIVAFEAQTAQVKRNTAGWLGNTVENNIVYVYQDRALTLPGWNGHYSLSDLITIEGYGIMSGVPRSVFDSATLNTRLREFITEEEEWFYLTAESFGYDRSSINRNARLRQLMKQAGDAWGNKPFMLGGIEF